MVTKDRASATQYFDGYKTSIASPILTGDRMPLFRSKQVEERADFPKGVY